MYAIEKALRMIFCRHVCVCEPVFASYARVRSGSKQMGALEACFRISHACA